MTAFQLFAIYLVFRTVAGFNCTSNIPDFDEIQQCCDYPTIILTDIVNECETETPSVLIWAECYFQKLDAIIDDKPNIKELKALAKTFLTDYPEWDQIFEEVIDNCNVEVNAKAVETRKRLAGPPFNRKDENPIYAHFIACVDKGLWLECPEIKRENTPRCTEIREYMQMCLNNFPPPYFSFVI